MRVEKIYNHAASSSGKDPISERLQKTMLLGFGIVFGLIIGLFH